jgi:hypothetical protein
MSHRILAVGDWAADLALLAPLLDAGYQVTVAAQGRAGSAAADSAPCLLLVALAPGAIPGLTPTTLGLGSVPWLAWNRDDNAAAALAAYHAGATAVLPRALPPTVLLRTVGRGAARGHAEQTGTSPTQPRRCSRGEPIALDSDDVLEVHAGIVALMARGSHQAPVLLGLCGAGRTVLGGQDPTRGIRLHAWTEATVQVRPWVAMLADPALPNRLRGQLREAEAWAAVQARPYLEDRLLGVLGLLAEQFGVAGAGGVLVDVRLTHADLAAATGTTRTTVTRILGDLRRRSLLRSVRAGRETRFCLLGRPDDGLGP